MFLLLLSASAVQQQDDQPETFQNPLNANGGDSLNAESWIKSPQPVFERSDENSVFGPGHNGFFQSPDGTQDWIVYHANDLESNDCETNRTTRAQAFTWNEDETPNFGEPV